MTRARLLLALALGACGGPTLALAQPRPDWSWTEERCDGVCGPRIAHHALRATGGAAAYGGLRLLGVRPRPAAWTGAALSGVVPHVIGVARGTYPFDGPDWVGDAWTAGGSALVAHRCARGVWSRRCGMAALLWAAGYTVLRAGMRP